MLLIFYFKTCLIDDENEKIEKELGHFGDNILFEIVNLIANRNHNGCKNEVYKHHH